jgi:hypothetical protein
MTFYEIEFPLAALNSDAVETALLELGASPSPSSIAAMSPCSSPSPAKSGCGATRWCAPCSILGRPSDAPGAISSARRPPGPAHHADRARARRRGPRLGARLAHRLEIHALRPAAMGMPHGRSERPRIPRPSSCASTPGWPSAPARIPPPPVPANPGSLPLAGRTLIDYGCGSGILGIAALKLGAARDGGRPRPPGAAGHPRAMHMRNGVSDRIDVHRHARRAEARP